MKGERETTPRRAELFVRPAVPDKIQERIDDVLADLRALENADVLADVTAQTWHRRVPITFQTEMDGGGVVSLYDDFHEWADTHDCSLTPYFDTVTSKCGELIVFPVICLAVYDGDELAAVFPHADGDTHYSVADGIDELVAAVEPETPGGVLSPVA